MSADGGFRRLIPPPRRRPTLFALVVRWRLELALVGGVVALFAAIGTMGVCIVALALVVVAVAVPQARIMARRVERTLVIPHRLRSALVQGGVTDRSGRVPWLVWARPLDEDVLVHVWLRSGVTFVDLEAAIPLIRSACGAVEVRIASPDLRPDRVLVRIVVPRWGRLRR